MASHPEYPDPLFEIDTLAALEEEGTAPHLLLAERRDPPGVRAQPGDHLLLCVRQSAADPCVAVARARVEGPAIRQGVPVGHEALYERVEGPRWWLPVSIEKFPAFRTEDELGLAVDALQARGQAGVWLLASDDSAARGGIPAARTASPSDVRPGVESPRFLIRSLEPLLALGVDLTAGDPATAFEQGRKKFWAVQVRADADRLVLDKPDLFSALTELEGAIRAHGPAAVVIDGPCGANGIRLNPERTGWVADTPGVRSAERELSQRGVKLFWTTEATLRSFSGAREWILRSLVLFGRLRVLAPASDSPRSLRAVETHPHAFFLFLWRAFGDGTALSPKRSAAGRSQRLTMLRMFLDFDSSLLPDDDAVDSAAAAILGILVLTGFALPVGVRDEGGQIWIPDVEALGKSLNVRSLA